jgi:sugar lactone lactonase YvrE
MPFTPIVLLALGVALLSCGRADRTKAPVPPETAEEMRALRAFLSNHPEDPAALFNLAVDEATVGERDSAIAMLEAMAEAHSGLDPKGAIRVFDGIAGDPRFAAVVSSVERENPPVGHSVRVLTIGERDLEPEGIAYDPVDRVFYVSSINKHKILRVTRDGQVGDFKMSGQDDLGETLGIKVDAVRRLLWVATDTPRGARAPASGKSPGGVFEYDLRTGALRFKHLAVPGPPGQLNDIALTVSGDAFATNTATGEVYRLSPDHDGIDVFLPAKSVGQANGIAFSSDDRVLFVAGWLGVARVDMATRQFRLLGKPHNVSDAGIDGLYFHRGALIGIQNPNLHPGRVVRYQLNAALDSIERAQVLDAYDPLFETPTTATIVGDSLFFIANPQLDKMLLTHPAPPPDSLHDLQLVKLPL